MSEWKARRFWQAVDVAAVGAGHEVRLDGRAISSPGRRRLVLPTAGLADAIAQEWRDQTAEIDPASMPMTRIANSALDKVQVQHRDVAALLAQYGDTDLVCYRADAPAGLVARQAAAWDPLLDWLELTLGVRLEPRTGVMHRPQQAGHLARLRREIEAMSHFHLAAFHDLVSLPGSLVIALATARGHMPAERLWEIAHVDEAWQKEQWGTDPEAEQALLAKKDDYLNAARFYRLASAE